MKKSILTLIALLSANIAAINAAPKLIGHRGSYWGVENSAEAFIAGAEKGQSIRKSGTGQDITGSVCSSEGSRQTCIKHATF